MSLDIGTALREGVQRTTKRNALLFMAVFFAVVLASTALTQTLLVEFTTAVAELAAEQGQDPGFSPEEVTGSTPFALPIPAGLAAGLALALALVSEAVSIVAVRTFVSDATAGLPEGAGRRLTSATVNGFIGGIVVGVFTAIGFVLLIVPGVFLYLSFLFLRQVIAAEDENFVAAMTRSWGLSKGNRIELLGLAIILLVLSLAASAPSFAAGLVNETAAAVANLVTSAVFGVFAVATVSRAYVQLVDEDAAEGPEMEDDDDADEAADDPYDAPLGPDDLPEP